MVVAEFVALLGAKIDQGSFTDVFTLLDHVQSMALKAARLIDDGIRKGFDSIHKTAMLGDEVGATAERLDMATDALQELHYAALLSDGSVDGINQGLKFLAKNAYEAATNGGEAAKAFAGIKLKENGKLRSLDDLLGDIADHFTKLPDIETKTARALAIFGRNGQELIPMLNKGKAGIAALREEAHRMGVVLDSNAIAASERYDDALKRLEATAQGLRNRFATPLIEKVSDLFDKIRTGLTSKGGTRAVEAFSKGFDRLLAVMDKLVDVFAWFLESEDRVTWGLFALQAVIIALIAGATSLSYAFISAAVSAVSAWVAAAAPFLALGAAIVLIGDELFTFIEGGDSALGRLIKTLDTIDPEDSPFVAMLRSAGSLLFDLTDPAKWKRLGQSITDYLLQPVRALVDALHWVLDKAGLADKFNPNVKSNLDEIAPMTGGFPGLADPLNTGGKTIGDSFAEKFPGVAPLLDKLDGWNMAAGDFVSARFNSTGAGNIPGGGPSTTTIGDVNVVLPPGTNVSDPDAIGEAVKKAVREELGNELSNTQGALGG